MRGDESSCGDGLYDDALVPHDALWSCDDESSYGALEQRDAWLFCDGE